MLGIELDAAIPIDSAATLAPAEIMPDRNPETHERRTGRPGQGSEVVVDG